MAFYNPKKYKKNVAVKVKSTQPHGKETIKNNFKKSIICESDSSLITSNSATKVKVDPFDDAFNSTILPRAELSTTISPPNMSFSKIIAEKELKGSPVTSLEKQLSSSPPKKSLKTPLPSKKKSLSDDVDVHELSSPEQQRRDSIDLKNTSGIKKSNPLRIVFYAI